MYLSRNFVLLLIVSYIFGPSMVDWLVAPTAPWYAPYVVWSCIIVVAALVHWRRQAR